MKKQAIYSISYNNNIYVGETTDIDKRIREHKHYQEFAYQLLDITERPIFKVLVELPEGTTKKQRLAIEKYWSDHFRQFKKVISKDYLEIASNGGRYNKGNKHWNYKGRQIKLIHKDGRIYEGIGVSNVDKELGFGRHLYQLLNGERKTMKGWRVG